MWFILIRSENTNCWEFGYYRETKTHYNAEFEIDIDIFLATLETKVARNLSVSILSSKTDTRQPGTWVSRETGNFESAARDIGSDKPIAFIEPLSNYILTPSCCFIP